MRGIINNAKSHLHGHHNETHETYSTDPLHTKDTKYEKEVLAGNQPSHLVGKAPIQPVGTTTVVKEETLIKDSGFKSTAPFNSNQNKSVPPLQTAPLQTAPLQQSTLIQPTITKEVVSKPTIVKETFLPQEKIEIQPVIHRERDQLEVHQVYQPLKEREIKPTQVINTTLADKVQATIVQDDSAFIGQRSIPQYTATKEFAPLQTQTIEKPAIIEEHVKKTIVEEVQPVLYKETIVPTLVRETQPIYEKIVEAPILIKETLPMRDLGMINNTGLNQTVGLNQTGFQSGLNQPGYNQSTGSTIVKETVVTQTTRKL